MPWPLAPSGTLDSSPQLTSPLIPPRQEEGVQCGPGEDQEGREPCGEETGGGGGGGEEGPADNRLHVVSSGGGGGGRGGGGAGGGTLTCTTTGGGGGVGALRSAAAYSSSRSIGGATLLGDQYKPGPNDERLQQALYFNSIRTAHTKSRPRRRRQRRGGGGGGGEEEEAGEEGEGEEEEEEEEEEESEEQSGEESDQEEEEEDNVQPSVTQPLTSRVSAPSARPTGGVVAAGQDARGLHHNMMPEQNGKRTSEALLGPGGSSAQPGGSGTGARGSGGSYPPYNPAANSKLRYQDFVPSSSAAAAGREQFHHLVDKANDWLRKNSDVIITCCETVTWMSTNPKALSDPEHVVLTKSVTANCHTHYRRGLRLWLTPRPSNQKRHHQTLGFIDYVPEKEDSFNSLISRANNKLDQTAIAGKVLTVETVNVPIVNGNVESGGCSWSESTNEDSPYAFVLRLFFTREDPAKENIGVKDFIPHPTEDGYEPFSQLIEKANTWLKDQTDVRVTNMQSLMVQRDEGPHSETGSACFYSLPSVTNDHPVEFFRILRLAYSRPTGELLAELPIIYPFTFESFMPELVPPKSARKKERLEKMKETFQRVNSFLRASDLDVICAETVLNPMQLVVDETAPGGQSEEMLTWMVTVRLYLTGQITSSPSPDGMVRPTPVHSLAARPSGASTRQKERKPSSEFEHPGPIFLRRVTTGHKPYKMLVAFICIFVSITIIVVLSVVYSNQ